MCINELSHKQRPDLNGTEHMSDPIRIDTGTITPDPNCGRPKQTLMKKEHQNWQQHDVQQNTLIIMS